MLTTNQKKAIVYFLTALATALGIAFGLSSCTVVRTVTTTSQCVNKGDTVTQITTKTVENYTASRDGKL